MFWKQNLQKVHNTQQIIWKMRAYIPPPGLSDILWDLRFPMDLVVCTLWSIIVIYALQIQTFICLFLRWIIINATDGSSYRVEEGPSRALIHDIRLLSARHKSESYGSDNNRVAECAEPVTSSPDIAGVCTATAYASTSNEYAQAGFGNNLAPPAMLQFAKTRKLSVERTDPRKYTTTSLHFLCGFRRIFTGQRGIKLKLFCWCCLYLPMLKSCCYNTTDFFLLTQPSTFAEAPILSLS